MVHEIGHWFGLPHDEYANDIWPVNIMSKGQKNYRPWCLSEWNLIQLDNAIDMGRSPRLHNNTGLKYISE